MNLLRKFPGKSKGNGAAPSSGCHDPAAVVSFPTALTPKQRHQQAVWRRHAQAITRFLKSPSVASEARVRGTGNKWIKAFLGEGPDAERARRSLDDRLFNVRLPVLAKHLHGLGARPVAECLLEIAGNDDGARVTLLAVLERYAKLDPATVRGVGGDRWPATIFPVGQA